MCVHIENPLFSELRIPYCVRAGETATFQLRYPPEKSRIQTGFTLVLDAPVSCGPLYQAILKQERKPQRESLP